MIYRVPYLINVFLTLCLVVTMQVGDFLVNYTTVHFHKALYDNGTHATIAAISWLIVCVWSRYKTVNQIGIETLICAIIGSAIDLDHFLVARSTSLKAATSIKGRAPLHCTTVPVFLCLSLFLMGSWGHIQWLKKFTLLIFTAFLSHHIRDANRRGIWFYPFGSTSPIPKWGYIGFTCLLPHVIYFVLSKSYEKRSEISDVISKEYLV